MHASASIVDRRFPRPVVRWIVPTRHSENQICGWIKIASGTPIAVVTRLIIQKMRPEWSGPRQFSRI